MSCKSLILLSISPQNPTLAFGAKKSKKAHFVVKKMTLHDETTCGANEVALRDVKEWCKLWLLLIPPSSSQDPSR
jgi:hypothetical protein